MELRLSFHGGAGTITGEPESAAALARLAKRELGAEVTTPSPGDSFEDDAIFGELGDA